MRLPRPKLRVGTLLIAVAAFALGIGADRIYNRFNLLMTRAAFLKGQADNSRNDAKAIQAMIGEFRRKGRPVQDTAELSRYMEYRLTEADQAEALRSQCLRAAFVPFLPLPPGLSYSSPIEPSLDARRIAPIPEAIFMGHDGEPSLP